MTVSEGLKRSGGEYPMRFRALILVFALVFGLALAPVARAQGTQPTPPSATAPPPPSTTAPPPQDTAKPEDSAQDIPKPDATQAPADQKQPDTKPDQVSSESQEPAATSDRDKKQDQQSTGNYKHNGGKDDVDAIGNRKMGGRGLGNWYSLEK